MEMDEKWQSGHEYLDMKEYFTWRDEQQKQAEQTRPQVDNNTISAEGRIYTI